MVSSTPSGTTPRARVATGSQNNDRTDHDIAGDDVGDRAFPARAGRYKWFDIAGLGVLAIVAVVLRFWTRSPMWLDEALTVNLASQPLHQIPDALRNDGHPPLYYYLLHGWMNLVGTSNVGIRSLAGIFGLLVVPATWLVGRRVGGRTVAWSAAVVVAVMPFTIRYSTENRMYSLVMLLALVGWLCADSALRRTRALPLIGLALCTSALLWTQYWAMWLGFAAAMVVIGRLALALRAGDRAKARASAWVLGALGVGAVSFVPWVPTLLYQQAHTGTPWATRSMPPTVVVNSVEALGGAANATDAMGGWYFTVLIVLGLLGVGVASGRIELDLRTRPHSRPLAWVAALTILIGVASMLASNTAFQPRYNAVWLPFALVIAGIGIATLRGPLVQRGALALVVVASAAGGYQNITMSRTQAAEAAATISQHGRPGDVVVVCPDQLGPSLTRVLPSGFDVGSFPTFSDARIVDWSDYVARTESRSPEDFAADLIARAGDDKRIFVVWSESYTTHKKLCTQLVTSLTGHRPDNRQILDAKRMYYESENVTVFEPST
ncbi:MAG TPA: glycosyltransferase family 39 protein [Acidimicrobiales bacterium]|nr:glycosyltransferase family 39 protein [Acidimicrobiales bacterium]